MVILSIAIWFLLAFSFLFLLRLSSIYRFFNLIASNIELAACDSLWYYSIILSHVSSSYFIYSISLTFCLLFYVSLFYFFSIRSLPIFYICYNSILYNYSCFFNYFEIYSFFKACYFNYYLYNFDFYCSFFIIYYSSLFLCYSYIVICLLLTYNSTSFYLSSSSLIFIWD